VIPKATSFLRKMIDRYPLSLWLTVKNYSAGCQLTRLSQLQSLPRILPLEQRSSSPEHHRTHTEATLIRMS